MTREQKSNTAKWLGLITALGAVATALTQVMPFLEWLWFNGEVIFILYPVKHTMYGVLSGALAGMAYPWFLIAIRAKRRDPSVTLARSRVVAAGITILVTCYFEPNREGAVFGFMSALSGTQVAMWAIRALCSSPYLPTPSNLEPPTPPPPANYENLRR